MKKHLLLFTFVLLSVILKSQATLPAISTAVPEWITYNGTQYFFYKNVTKTDRAGSVFVAGATFNTAGNSDILIAKYSSTGQIQWIQQYAGLAGMHDFAAGLAVTNSAAYLTGVVFNNTVTAESDAITIKFSTTTGVIQWVSTYDGAANSLDGGKHVAVSGSDLYVTGGSYNASFNSDFLTIKYDEATGTQSWASTYDYVGADDAALKSVVSGANLTVTGAVSTATANAYKYTTLTYAVSSGSLTATNVSTVVTTTSVNAVTDLIGDGSGNIYIVGSMTAVGQGENMYVQKLNGTLSSVWTYTFNGASNLDDIAKSVQVDNSSNVFITGYSTSSTQGKNICLIKLNSSGVNQFTVFGNDVLNKDDEAFDMVLDIAGNPYVAGYQTVNASNQTDYYTAKYNSTTGAVIWEVLTDGTSGLSDKATNMALDTLENVITTGESETSPGVYNYMTVKYKQADVTTPTDFNGEIPDPNHMYFANRGQITYTNSISVSDIRFYSNNTNPKHYFKSRSQSYVFSRVDTIAATTDTLHRIDLSFNNCSETAETYPLEKQESGYLNYHLGYISENLTNVKGNKRLITPNLYPNIDLMSSSNKNGIKYYFIVKPGGDMRDIKLEFTGASSYSLNGTTNELSINSSIGNITFDKPVAYQLTSANATVAVTSFSPTWVTNGASNKYKFNDGAYTASLTLVIEVDRGNSFSSATSSVCDWSTFYGGSAHENVRKVITDAIGNSFFVGETSSSNFPNVTGGYQTTLSPSDGVIIKLDPNGAPVWGTYFSGNSNTNIYGIALNSVGEIYICGSTGDVAMPLVPAANSTHSGLLDAFIAKFNSGGNALLNSQYYGTSGVDEAVDIAIDGSNNIYVVGITDQSTGIPLASGGYNQTSSGGGVSDGFIAKFNSSDVLSWGSYFGGDQGDAFNSVKITQGGNILTSGYTKSQTKASSNGANTPCAVPVTGNFPDCTGGGSYYGQNFGGGFADNFIAEFNTSGNMIWSTYYGGAGQENDARIVLGTNSNEFYLVGNSNKNSYSLTQGSGAYLQTQPAFGVRGYIAKFVNRQPTWFTFLGDGTNTFANAGICDAAGNVYVTGSAQPTSGYFATACQPVSSGSNGTNFPKCFPANIFNQSSYGGGSAGDAFLMGFNSANQIIWSTLYGAGSGDDGKTLAFDAASNKLVFAGNTSSGSGGFPLFDPATGNYQQNINMGGTNNRDCFFAKFCLTGINLVGIKENSFDNSSILVFPNPNNGNFEISLTGFNASTVSFELIDIMGRFIDSGNKEISEENIKFNFASKNLKKGMYFLKLNSKDKYKTIKIIVE